MDINRALRNAVKSGTVFLGVNETKAALENNKAKMIVVAENCPEREFFLKATGVSVIEYDGTRAEMGAACGKLFHVSVVAIIDPGESQILSA